jgi:uncharacterized spore protein YtfJ
MDLKKLMSQPRDAATVGQVFGEPIERDGTTIIPVAKVMGGGGGGENRSGHSDEDDESGEAGDESSVGGGFGFRAVPAGVYVVKDGRVSWQPALDLNRVILGGQLIGAVFIIIVGGLVRTFLKQREARASHETSRLLPAGVLQQAARRLGK